MDNNESPGHSAQEREEVLFTMALATPASQRPAFLAASCGNDEALRQRLENLLAAYAGENPLPEPEGPGQTVKLEIEETPDETVGLTLGRYKLLEKVGEGGCGVVYVAEQTVPVRRRVALKVIKLGMDTKAVVARFEAERQALAMMDHPNIAKVLDAGTTELGRPYFVMELVRGIRITDYCDQNNLTTRERIDLFIKVCQAIQHAHQKGIIHRDIKPSNILVTLHDGVPVPKVIDFGIAKATEGRLTEHTVYTQLHQFIGTPAYMSPEQAEMSGLDIDTRSDIYSLGVLLYELLVGRTPFDSRELMESGLDAMRKTIREKEPERPSTKLATLPGEDLTTAAKRRSTDTSKLVHQLRGDLDWISMKCLEKDRTRRYDTATGLASDLKRYLNNEPVVARPPSNVYRFQKLVRRNKLAVLGATAIMGALLIGALVSVWQAVRAMKAEQIASQQKVLAENEARQAQEEKKIADRETIAARRSAAEADARYLLQENLLPAALAKATEAFKISGQWEDGLLIHNIAAAARKTWVRSARVLCADPPTVACAATSQGVPCVAIIAGNSLRVLDARNGTPLGDGVDAGYQHLFAGADSNTLMAVSSLGISVLSLPSLALLANKASPSPILNAITASNCLVVYLQNHDVCMFNSHTLTETASFNWDTNPVSKKLQFPTHACVSPDGKIAVFHGGSHGDPVLIWDLRKNPPVFSSKRMVVQELQFVDNRHLATWAQREDNLGIVQLLDMDHMGAHSTQILGSEDLKAHLQLQACSMKSWGYESDLPILGLVGRAGLMLNGMNTRDSSIRTKTLSTVDRFANLAPTETEPLEFLAADLAKGILMLRCHNDALIFRLGWNFWSYNMDDYAATAFRDGLISISTDYTPTSVRLIFTPFDPRKKLAAFSLQWPGDSKWIPWSVAITPDASTAVVIAEETDSDDEITARYKRTRVLIYHPGPLPAAPSAWPIQNYFEVDAPIGINFGARFTDITPDGRTLIYWNSATTVTRYNADDGKPLGTLELGLVAAHSRDGRRVAAVSPQGRLRVYDVASGETLLDAAGKPASGLCFSTDGSRVVAAQSGALNAYDVTSGRRLSSIESSLVPLAYPSQGNRFLAFQPDNSGSGGSSVLADTANATVVAVLNRAGNAFAPAFFSDSGEQIAFVSSRWYAEVVRSLHPEEFSEALNAGLPDSYEIKSLPPTNLVTTSPTTALYQADDVAALTAHLGDRVRLRGRVRNVSLILTRTAANIYLAGADARSCMVWVPPYVYPKLTALLGKNLNELLSNHVIEVTGRLKEYRGDLEVTLEEPSKLSLLGENAQLTLPKSNSTVAGP